MLALMKFIGKLFTHQMVGVKIIGRIVRELIGQGMLPEEHKVECVLELLLVVGRDLDSTGIGRTLVSQFFSRLLDLKQAKTDEEPETPAYSDPVRLAIDGLCYLRARGWKAVLQPSGRLISMQISEQDAHLKVNSHYLSGDVAHPPVHLNADATLADLRTHICQGMKWKRIGFVDSRSNNLPLHHSLRTGSDIIAKEMVWKAS